MQKQFLEILREHMTIEARENNLKQNTVQKHEYQFNNIAAWLQSCGMEKITIAELRPRHMDELKEWLFKHTPTKKQAHVNRHIRLCREAVNLAVRRDYLPYNCLMSVKLKTDKIKEVVSLNDLEIHRFTNTAQGLPFRKLVVNLFLFQCYTGLSFMDLWRFELFEDKITVSGTRNIFVTWVTCATGRGKTGRKYWAELIPEAREILEQYPQGFPEVHVQSYNRALQKIARSMGIQKHLTTHIARKTFATLMRARGFSIPAIADMLGNTEAVARKHYIEQGKEAVTNELVRVNKWDMPLRLVG